MKKRSHKVHTKITQSVKAAICNEIVLEFVNYKKSFPKCASLPLCRKISSLACLDIHSLCEEDSNRTREQTDICLDVILGKRDYQLKNHLESTYDYKLSQPETARTLSKLRQTFAYELSLSGNYPKQSEYKIKAMLLGICHKISVLDRSTQTPLSSDFFQLSANN